MSSLMLPSSLEMRNGTLTISLIRNFLFSTVNKEFLIFLFFLALSGCFWLLMSLNETYEKEYCIPVSLTGVPHNVVMTGNISDTVRVTVRDKGFTLLTYSYGRKLRPLSFRFSSYAGTERGKGYVPVADVQKQVLAQLYGSSRLVSVKADHLDFFFNYGLSKRVHVRFAGKISMGKTYYMANTTISPNVVTIYASKQLLDSINTVYTQSVNLENLQDTIRRTVGLRQVRGVKIVPDSVQVAFYPDVLTEESMEVPITAVNMPDGKVLRTFPAKVNVRFTVGARMFRSIRADMFRVEVDYNDIEEQPSDKCTLRLVKWPRNVSLAQLEISQVDYLIEQQ